MKSREGWPTRAEGYEIHLYCPCYGQPPRYTRQGFEVVSAHREADARREMRNSGWKIFRDGTQLCPKCAQKDESHD